MGVTKRPGGLDAARHGRGRLRQGRDRWPNFAFEAVAEVGHPSNVIVRAAERGVDMIMIGGVSGGPLPRMFTGRVTKEVCGWAHCAVLVVTA